jgi:hypothetical protein
MILVTFRPARSSVWPIEEVSYTCDHIPREGEYVHLHEQGRLASVSAPPVYMITERGMTGVIVTVLGTDPERQFIY